MTNPKLERYCFFFKQFINYLIEFEPSPPMLAQREPEKENYQLLIQSKSTIVFSFNKL